VCNDEVMQKEETDLSAKMAEEQQKESSQGEVEGERNTSRTK